MYLMPQHHDESTMILQQDGSSPRFHTGPCLSRSNVSWQVDWAWGTSWILPAFSRSDALDSRRMWCSFLRELQQRITESTSVPTHAAANMGKPSLGHVRTIKENSCDNCKQTWRGPSSCVISLNPASKSKSKVKVHPKNRPWRPREGIYVELYSFFNLGAGWGWVVSATPRSLYPPGRTRSPLYRGLGGPQGQSERMRKISPPSGIRSPDRPAHSKSIYSLSYLYSQKSVK
jgi:hypothetical protein